MGALVTIVDSDRRFVADLRIALLARGYSVISAHTIPAAQQILLKERVDVLLTELWVDGADARALLHTIHERRPNTRAVMMTANASANDYKHCLALGAVELLTKPFSLDALLHALETALDQSHSVRGGGLQGAGLADVLQVLNMENRSVSLHVGEHARIDMRDGEVVHAESPPNDGWQALALLLADNKSVVRTSPYLGGRQTIFAPFGGLMMQTMNAIEEARTSRSQSGVQSVIQRIVEPIGHTGRGTLHGTGRGSASPAGQEDSALVASPVGAPVATPAAHPIFQVRPRPVAPSVTPTPTPMPARARGRKRRYAARVATVLAALVVIAGAAYGWSLNEPAPRSPEPTTPPKPGAMQESTEAPPTPSPDIVEPERPKRRRKTDKPKRRIVRKASSPKPKRKRVRRPARTETAPVLRRAPPPTEASRRARKPPAPPPPKQKPIEFEIVDDQSPAFGTVD